MDSKSIHKPHCVAGRVANQGKLRSSTQRVKNIVESDLTELKVSVLQDPDMVKAMSGVVDADVINHVLIPKIVITKYPNLSAEEIEEVREHLVADMVIRHAEKTTGGDRRFIKLRKNGFFTLS